MPQPPPTGPRHSRRPSRRGRLAGAVALVLSVTPLAACGGAGEPGSSDEPETAGITLYSGRIPPLIGPVIDRYERRTDRDVQVRFGDSATLAAQLSEEGENSPADVFFSQDAGSLGALEERDLLSALPEQVLDSVPRRFRSPEGAWVGISARARVIAYADDIPRRALPDSTLELTDPKWRGRVGWAPTNASLQAYVTALRVTEGEDAAREWLEGMVANDTQVYESNAPVRDAIAAGEIDLGLINHYYVAQAIAAEGSDYPVAIHFPPDDLGSMVNATGVAVLTASDEPAEALDFVRYLLRPSSQRYFAESSKEYPLISSVEPDPDLVPLARIPAPRVGLAQLTDLEGTLELMRETGAL